MSTASQTPDILAQIIAHQHDVVAAARGVRPVAELRRDPGHAAERRSLRHALTSRRPAVIAECKRRSPSKGVLREPYDPVAIARGYAAAGAAAISVLTNERFFGGSLDDLRAVRAAVPVPVLRKDFVVDAYQLDEARAAGADAVLLIVAGLTPAALGDLHRQALELGLEVLTEVHDEAELEIARGIGASIIGVNNRNLRTLAVDVHASDELIARIPREIIAVSESGLKSADDVSRLSALGYRAFLMGERFMTAGDPGAVLRELLRACL